MVAWFEDEDFWAATYPILFPEENFVVAEEQVEKILKRVGFRPGAVLDLACGPGRHAVAFRFQLTIYSGQELKDLRVQAEFAEVTLFGDLDGSRYGPRADRLIALGRKAA